MNKYVLLLDNNNDPLTCELSHHLECHSKDEFHVLGVFNAESIEDADVKSNEILDRENYQLPLFLE